MSVPAPFMTHLRWSLESPRLRHFLLGMALLVLLSCLALWAWSETSQRREILRLPAQERQAVYARTLEELETLCEDSGNTLRTHCRAQALFIVQFPECDDACRGVASKHLAQPAR